MPIKNPHDAIFKEIEQIKENAADLIKAAFPLEIAENIDYSSLNLENRSYVDENLSEYFSDIVYSCTYSAKVPLKITLLFEHKSQIIPFPHVQLLKYIVRIFDINIQENRSLVPVLPIIFYHGQKYWKIRKFSDYFGNLPRELLKFIPNFEYLLIDLSKYADEDIRLRIFQREANKITFLFMKHIFDGQFAEENIEKYLKIGHTYYERSEGRAFLQSLLNYLFSALETDQQDKVKNSLKKVSATGEEVAMTIATKLREEGKIEGKREGKLEGKLEGITEGKIEGITEGKLEAAKRMLEKGFSIADIADITELPADKIESLKKK